MSDERKRQRALRRNERRKKQEAKRRKARILSGKTLRGPEGSKGGKHNRCRAKTRTTGEPCPMYRAVLEDPVDGKLYKAATCYAHLPKKIQERFNAKPIGGKQPGTGGLRVRPKPNQVLREIFEQEITTWIQPYIEALTAETPVVVGNGRHARVELMPDHRTRQRAAEAIWDRVYGKPKQTTELTGADGGPVEVEVPKTKERELEVAQILAAAGAVDVEGAQDKLRKAATSARAAERN